MCILYFISAYWQITSHFNYICLCGMFVLIVCVSQNWNRVDCTARRRPVLFHVICNVICFVPDEYTLFCVHWNIITSVFRPDCRASLRVPHKPGADLSHQSRDSQDESAVIFKSDESARELCPAFPSRRVDCAHSGCPADKCSSSRKVLRALKRSM